MDLKLVKKFSKIGNKINNAKIVNIFELLIP